MAHVVGFFLDVPVGHLGGADDGEGVVGFFAELREDTAGGIEALGRTLDEDGIGFDAVGSLPEEGVTIVADPFILLAGLHAVGAGLESFGGIEEGALGRFGFLFVGEVGGGDLAFGEHVAAFLIEVDLEGVGGTGGVPDTGGTFEDDVFGGTVEAGVVTPGVAGAFLVVEIGGLFEGLEVSGFGSKRAWSSALEVFMSGSPFLRGRVRVSTLVERNCSSWLLGA